MCARAQVPSTAASTPQSTPQTAVKTEAKTEAKTSPAPKGPNMASPNNTPPKSDSASASPLSMSQSADKCVPIAQLTMYQRPTIKGRIGAKDTVREFKGRDGATKKVFSIEIMDESCDMKATFWDKAVDKFFDVLEVRWPCKCALTCFRREERHTHTHMSIYIWLRWHTCHV